MPASFSGSIWTVSESRLVLGEWEWWHKEGYTAAVCLCPYLCCLPCTYPANGTTEFPLASLDPPAPVVGIKGRMKRWSRDTSCSLLCYYPHLLLWVSLWCGCWKTCLCQQMPILKMCPSLQSIAYFILFEREKYLVQSWNTIKSLCRWKLPLFSAVLSSA